VDASSAVSLSTVRDAARRIAAYVRRTPLAFSPYLSRRAGARVWLKLECMNHGLGVAYAAQAWGVVHADVYVPVTAPQSKVDKLRAFGVGVHQQGATYEDAHQAALSHARRTGATYVEAYDDLDVIAGQGTMGLEILEDLQPDVVIVPVGGGGMVAGVSIAAGCCDRASGGRGHGRGRIYRGQVCCDRLSCYRRAAGGKPGCAAELARRARIRSL